MTFSYCFEMLNRIWCFVIFSLLFLFLSIYPMHWSVILIFMYMPTCALFHMYKLMIFNLQNDKNSLLSRFSSSGGSESKLQFHSQSNRYLCSLINSLVIMQYSHIGLFMLNALLMKKTDWKIYARIIHVDLIYPSEGVFILPTN